MHSSRTRANQEIRATEDHPLVSGNASALDDALREATDQTAKHATRQVAYVLTWHGGTIMDRVLIERDHYAGLKAQLLELFHRAMGTYRAGLIA